MTQNETWWNEQMLREENIETKEREREEVGVGGGGGGGSKLW